MSDIGKAYTDGYNQGVKDFAKFLIDKSENGTVSILEIPDYVKGWCDNACTNKT